MDSFVLRKVPPTAQSARLLSLKRRWDIYYRSTLGDTEGRIELRHIDPSTRRATEGGRVVASWDISPVATA